MTEQAKEPTVSNPVEAVVSSDTAMSDDEAYKELLDQFNVSGMGTVELLRLSIERNEKQQEILQRIYEDCCNHARSGRLKKKTVLDLMKLVDLSC